MPFVQLQIIEPLARVSVVWYPAPRLKLVVSEVPLSLVWKTDSVQKDLLALRRCVVHCARTTLDVLITNDVTMVHANPSADVMMTVVPERCVKVLRAVRDVDRILVAQTIWLVLITNVQIHVRIHGPAELTQNA